MRKLKMLENMSFRWLWAVAVLALLVSTVVLTTGPVSAAHTVVVDDDGMAEVGNCNKKTATFSTIQGAIDDAGTHAGTTILVCPGTYKEHVEVDKTGLTLQGISQGRKRAVIDGENDNTGPVVDITADDVTLDNFVVKNSGGASGNPGIGVESDGNTITHNTVINNRCGINLWEGGGAGTLGAHDNTVEHNTFFDNSRDGIRLQDDSGVDGKNTVRFNNTHHNDDNGIGLRSGAKDNDIKENDAHHNGKDGIFLKSDTGDDNTVEGNHSHNNVDDGIEDATSIADNDVSEAANNVHNNGGTDCVGCDA